MMNNIFQIMDTNGPWKITDNIESTKEFEVNFNYDII